MNQDFIEITGAREHNLKNISLDIPRNKLVVVTGLSGSGKSSLAFDTIFAEGQRRYIETFSAYARQFLGAMERPDVDSISGLSPVISIEQKTVNRSPRSTVGTITEIYDFIRLLFARASDAYSYITNEKMVRYSDDQICDAITNQFSGHTIMVLAPMVRGRKGHYRELFEQIRKYGFLNVRVDGTINEVTARFQVDRYKIHDIEIVIDCIDIGEQSRMRLRESLKIAMKHGKGTIMILDFGLLNDALKKSTLQSLPSSIAFFSRHLMCPTSGISYNEPEPNTFSFNSPYGACPVCNGLGEVSEMDINKIFPDKNLSVKKGGIAPLGKHKDSWLFRQLETIGMKYGFNLDTPVKDFSDEAIRLLLYGSEETFSVRSEALGRNHLFSFEGITNTIIKQSDENISPSYIRWVQGFMNNVPCRECHGSRLKKEALYFRVDGKDIYRLCSFDIQQLYQWFDGIEERISERQRKISSDVLKEIRSRLKFLLDVGLDYLSLNRSARSLSGGEAQRIRLATQIGSQLVGVLYILDEPSIGLHQRDNKRLIAALKNLRDLGNSVIVVEHDRDMIVSADHIIDIGPVAGIHGGHIVAQGTPEEFCSISPELFSNGSRENNIADSLTSSYLNGKKEISVPEKRRKGSGKKLVIAGAKGNNLKNVSVDFPLGTFVCVTGVSGSGKSSLINDTLYPILCNHFYRSVQRPLAYTSAKGLEHLDKVIEIDQSPIGRTPRSNPATYTGMFSDIRALFSLLPEAKVRGYKPGRFSFNVRGGRCESCQGAGLKTIEMNFLPDVHVLCEACNGRRYNRETLEVRYKGKSIGDVLEMNVDQAMGFFESIPSIISRIKSLHSVGLGYVKLGQASTTLSGGEAQRIKLASELSKRDTGNTFYILDEPTTGLHFEDVKLLLDVLNRLVDNGNTVVVIEHNMDIIKMADHIIDMGPEGGINGGQVVCTGTPEEVAKVKESYTGQFLSLLLTRQPGLSPEKKQNIPSYL